MGGVKAGKSGLPLGSLTVRPVARSISVWRGECTATTTSKDFIMKFGKTISPNTSFASSSSIWPLAFPLEQGQLKGTVPQLFPGHFGEHWLHPAGPANQGGICGFSAVPPQTKFLLETVAVLLRKAGSKDNRTEFFSDAVILKKKKRQ